MWLESFPMSGLTNSGIGGALAVELNAELDFERQTDDIEQMDVNPVAFFVGIR